MKTLLFCISHAGANVAYYNPLASFLPEDIELCLLEIPGRGRRSKEALVNDFEILTQDIRSQIKAKLEKENYPPYVIFGHSMGGALAFNYAQTMIRDKDTKHAPKLLFISSSRNMYSIHAPYPKDLIKVENMPEELFYKLFSEIDNKQILQQPELIDYIKPILIADYAALETWRTDCIEPIEIPIFVLYGSEEKEQNFYRLASRTRGTFNIKVFKGGHFYMENNWKELGLYISKAIKEI